jgi:hypothetical protein
MDAAVETRSNPIPLTSKRSGVVNNLIDASHRKVLKLNEVVDWAQGVDKSMLPKLEETAWLYGTPYWDAMTPEQRLEVLWLETARDVSYFIWLEQALPELYVGYVNKYNAVLTDDVREYLMIFSREEIVHTLLFRRYLKTADLELWSHPATIPQFSNFEQQLPNRHPVYGIIWNLLIEWFAELNSIYQTQHDSIDPLTRKMFREHHMEEVRHIAFAKHIAENFFETAPQDEVKEMCGFFKKGYKFLVDEYTYMPEIARFTSFDFPIKQNDQEAIEAIRNSPHNKALNELRFKDVNDWCRKYGII